MRRATAVRRLRTIAERCQQVCSLWEVGSGLVAVHAFGPVLDVGEGEEPSIEVIQIALVVNEHPDEVTWCVRPARYTGLPYVLDLEKAPVDWYFRPASPPVGNHRIVRPLPIWTRDGGVLDPALAALADRDGDALDRLREPGVRPVVLQRQLAEDLAASGRHLARVRDAYWSRRWRQAHHAAGVYPENYLWDAVNGYLDLQSAVDGAPAAASSPGRAAVQEPTGRAPSGPATGSGPRPGAAAVGDPLPLDLDPLPSESSSPSESSPSESSQSARPPEPSGSARVDPTGSPPPEPAEAGAGSGSGARGAVREERAPGSAPRRGRRRPATGTTEPQTEGERPSRRTGRPT